MTASTVLLTGFEPFDGETVNPSWLIAESLQGELAGARVASVRLPCAFAAALPALDRALQQQRPDLVVCLGQAGRPAIGVERVAINLCDARIADNTGAQPIDCPVIEGGPAAYFSTLPVKAMTQAVREAGIAAVEVSHSAGTFVCNQVFYGLMHRLRSRPGVRGGFIHVPMLPEQAARRSGVGPGMPLATMRDAVRSALACAIVTGADAGTAPRRSEGTLF